MSAFEDQSGKVSNTTFKNILLPKCGKQRNEVVQGPAFGVDTAVVDLGDGQGLAISSDPTSLIPGLGLEESAWLSVHLLANDMATTGFAPQFAQFVLNLPTTLSANDFKTYWNFIHQFCEDIGVSITGGHTGQIPGQNSTISGGGTMFLKAPLNEMITSNKAEPGDIIVVTKETALTSTSILAKSFPKTVENKIGSELYQIACDNFYQTSSLNDALEAASVLKKNSELKAMHDVTEGGVLGAICETAEASGCGFTIYNEQLPIGQAQLLITNLFDIDHRYCIGAGSMIMVVKSGMENKLIDHLKASSIPAAVVGEMTPKTSGFKIIESNEEKVISFNGNDPYWAAFFKALNDGWK